MEHGTNQVDFSSLFAKSDEYHGTQLSQIARSLLPHLQWTWRSWSTVIRWRTASRYLNSHCRKDCRQISLTVCFGNSPSRLVISVLYPCSTLVRRPEQGLPTTDRFGSDHRARKCQQAGRIHIHKGWHSLCSFELQAQCSRASFDIYQPVLLRVHPRHEQSWVSSASQSVVPPNSGTWATVCHKLYSQTSKVCHRRREREVRQFWG